MTNKVLLSLATVALFAATAQADSYSFESTNSWLNISDDIVVDSAINNPTQRTISLGDLNPTSVRITGAITNLILNAAAPAAYTGTLPQASITAVDAEPDYWYGWHCTSEGGEWVALTDLDAPAEGNDYLVNIEFKDGYVRYGIGAEPTWASNGSDGWITNAMNFASITKVGFAGYGTFTNYCGMAVKTVTVTAADLPNNVSPAQAASNATLDNGLTVSQTVLLGLNSASTKPFTAPVQTTESGKLGFTIGNVVSENVKGYVTYTVEEYSDAACNSPTGNKSDETAAGDQATMNAVSDGVRYYKIKIKFQ